MQAASQKSTLPEPAIYIITLKESPRNEVKMLIQRIKEKSALTQLNKHFTIFLFLSWNRRPSSSLRSDCIIKNSKTVGV